MDIYIYICVYIYIIICGVCVCIYRHMYLPRYTLPSGCRTPTPPAMLDGLYPFGLEMTQTDGSSLNGESEGSQHALGAPGPGCGFTATHHLIACLRIGVWSREGPTSELTLFPSRASSGDVPRFQDTNGSCAFRGHGQSAREAHEASGHCSRCTYVQCRTMSAPVRREVRGVHVGRLCSWAKNLESETRSDILKCSEPPPVPDQSE